MAITRRHFALSGAAALAAGACFSAPGAEWTALQIVPLTGVNGGVGWHLAVGAQVAFACNQPRGFSQWCAGQSIENIDPAVPSLDAARAHIADTRERVLAIACDDPTVFQEIQIAEYDGAGKRAR